MSRALLIGGFGANETMLEPVAEAIAGHFEEVDLLTLRQAETNPNEVRKAGYGVEVFAHSGGIGPTAEARLSVLHGLGPAVPSWASALLFRTISKQRQMHRENHQAAIDFERESTKEILGHPFFHFRELFRVAAMDAVGISAFHQAHDAQANLAFFDADAYFRLSEKDRARAELGEINIVHLSGQHDELVLNPKQTIDSYLEAL